MLDRLWDWLHHQLHLKKGREYHLTAVEVKHISLNVSDQGFLEMSVVLRGKLIDDTDVYLWP